MLIVADDTGTDWTAVAEVIVGWSCTNEECDHHECKFLRAAAVGLRRLAQLDTAIGDPGNLRLLADTFDLPILRRIADAAVLGSGEQPEGPTTAVSDCPTCWSTDPAKRWNDAAEAVCPDSWHGGRR